MSETETSSPKKRPARRRKSSGVAKAFFLASLSSFLSGVLVLGVQYFAFERTSERAEQAEEPARVEPRISVEQRTDVVIPSYDVDLIHAWQRARRRSDLPDAIVLRAYYIRNSSSEDVSDLRLSIVCRTPCVPNDQLWARYELHPNDPSSSPGTIRGDAFRRDDFERRLFRVPRMAGWADLEVSLAGSEVFVSGLTVEGGGMSYPGYPAPAGMPPSLAGRGSLGIAFLAFGLSILFLAVGLGTKLWSRWRRRAMAPAEISETDGIE